MVVVDFSDFLLVVFNDNNIISLVFLILGSGSNLISLVSFMFLLFSFFKSSSSSEIFLRKFRFLRKIYEFCNFVLLVIDLVFFEEVEEYVE